MKLSITTWIEVTLSVVILLYVATVESACDDRYHFTCANGKCVPFSYVCNRIDSCGDRSDEGDICTGPPCAPFLYTCGNGKCVSIYRVCDGKDTCGDNSDENDDRCIIFPGCGWSRYICTNKQCVQRRWVCDGHKACVDNSDEENCAHFETCPADSYLCTNKRCVPHEHVCDGDNDCGDNSDEEGCHSPACGVYQHNYYRCADKQCLPRRWVCDGVNHCNDNSDEENCAQSESCSSGTHLLCTNKRCVPYEDVCNGVNDCGDNTDEEGCHSCNPGLYGGHCQHSCSQGCTDTCDAVTGSCSCGPWWTGKRCAYKIACNPGHYGINCEHICSQGCTDTCDGVDGSCSCQQWWIGNECTIEIQSISLPTEPPQIVSVNESSVVIRWKTISNVPADLMDYYQYAIEYKEISSGSWEIWQTRHSHKLSSDQYQDTVTGLRHNADYDVQIISYRVQGSHEDETGRTGAREFSTACRGPSVPQNVTVNATNEGSSATMIISWKHPQIVGCNRIAGYDIRYRVTSTSEDWTIVAVPSAFSTSYTLRDLGIGDYVVRVVVTNDDGLSNFTDAPPVYIVKGEDDIPRELIIGIISSLALFAIVVAIVAILFRRHRKRAKSSKNQRGIQLDERPNDDNTLGEEIRARPCPPPRREELAFTRQSLSPSEVEQAGPSGSCTGQSVVNYSPPVSDDDEGSLKPEGHYEEPHPYANTDVLRPPVYEALSNK